MGAFARVWLATRSGYATDEEAVELALDTWRALQVLTARSWRLALAVAGGGSGGGHERPPSGRSPIRSRRLPSRLMTHLSTSGSLVVAWSGIRPTGHHERRPHRLATT